MVSITLVDKILRGCIIFQYVGAVVVLAMTASMISSFVSPPSDSYYAIKYPHPPGKLSFNLAAAVITLVALIILSALQRLKATWYEKLTRPKFCWPRLSIHAFFFLIWLIATGTAFWSCSDICDPLKDDYNGTGDIRCYITGQSCTCSLGGSSSFKRASYKLKPPKGGKHSSASRYKTAQAFDILMMLSFLVTGVLIFYRWHMENSGPVDRHEIQDGGEAKEGDQHQSASNVHEQPEYQQEEPKRDAYQGT